MQVLRSWRSVSAGLAGVAAAACLGACSAGSGGTPVRPAGSSSAAGGAQSQVLSPVAAVQAAYTTTTGSRTARVAVQEQVHTAGQSAAISGTGAENFVDRSSEFTFGIEGQTLQVRSFGTVEYVKLPAAEVPTLGGKSWLRVDLAKVSPALAQQLRSQTSDPTQGLSLLKSRARSVTKIGTENVRGTSTTHYRAALDLATVLKSYPASTRAQVQQVYGNRTTIDVDVWIDAQGRARRVTLPASQSNGVVSVTVDMYDFGAPLDVAPPPAAQTQDGTALLGKTMGG